MAPAVDRFVYRAHGLNVVSNLELSGLAVPTPRATDGSPGAHHTLEVELVELPVHAPTGSPALTVGWQTQWRESDRALVVRYEHDRFAWSLRATTSRLEVRRTDHVSRLDIARQVETTGLGACLTQGGRPLLHGAGVDIAGAASLLLAASGTGKSTLAGALVRAGHALISDDLLTIELDEPATPLVHRGAARMRLYADSAVAAGWDPGDMTRIFEPDFMPDKREIAGGHPEVLDCGARPVAAIYILTRSPSAPHVKQRTLPPARAVAALLAHSYSSRFVGFSPSVLLQTWATLAAAVPVIELTLPDDLSRLQDAVAAVVAGP